jgi:DivIVA domain-containing protein
MDGPMADTDPRRRLISTSSRLSRDEIANQAFPPAFRGVSEAAVRSFLRKVAEEIDLLHARNHELAQEIAALHEEAAEPVKMEENDLLAAVGEETARVLRSAKESAEEIRRSAEERAAQLLHDAHEEARALREDAEHVASARAREIDEAAAEMIREAERLAREVQEGAELKAKEFVAQSQAEARAEVEAAKRKSRELVAEAQASRDRLLHELSRRRAALESQVDALRAGRDRLVEAYRTVKRTMEDATEALREAEARGPAPSRPRVTSAALPVHGIDPEPEPEPVYDEPEPVYDEREQELAAGPDDRHEPAPARPRAEPRVGSITLGELEPSPPRPPEPRHVRSAEPRHVRAAEPRQVTVRAERALAPSPVPADEVPEASPEVAPEVEEPAAPPHGAAAPTPPQEAAAEVEQIFARLKAEAAEAPATEAPTAEAPEAEPGEPAEGERPAEVHEPEPDGDAGTVHRRDLALEELAADLVRAVKRVVRDEQNLVLEAVRRHRGTPSADDVLPPIPEQDASFADATEEFFVAACALGASLARELGYDPAPVTGDVASGRARDLAASLARTLTDPLRGRLGDALAEAAAIDDPDLEERVRSRYREWKTPRVDAGASDALAGAYARGLFDALPDGVRLRWIAGGHAPCPDCADNALEPCDKGSAFPTGQPHPPAHPGCRCLAVPDGEAVGAGTGADGAAATG